MKQLTQVQEYVEFKAYYESISGINLPIEYLEKARVYGFYNKEILAGGFCINTKRPFRTIQTFANKANHTLLFQKTNSLNIKEVTCFWISKEIQSTLFRFYLWFQMASKASSKKLSAFVIYGTKHQSLARIYDLSDNAMLLHHDRDNLKTNYIFIAKSEHVISGLIQQIYKRIIGVRNSEFPKSKLKVQNIENEIFN